MSKQHSTSLPEKRPQCRTSFALKFRPFDKVDRRFDEGERCFDTVAKSGNNVEATVNNVASCFDNCCWCGPGLRQIQEIAYIPFTSPPLLREYRFNISNSITVAPFQNNFKNIFQGARPEPLNGAPVLRRPPVCNSNR